MKNHPRLLASTILCCVLAACGGGGDDASTPAAAAPVPEVTTAGVNTGSVSAPFVRSANARSILLGIGAQSFGVLSTSIQDANGVMTTIDSNVLSGATVTKDISGDANVAQGRWVAGTYTSGSGSVVLTGTDNQAYHYVAYNNLAAFPTTGSAACDAGKFTAPGRESGPSTANFGTASGSAAITFGVAGATVSGSIVVTAGASTGTASLNSSLAGVTSLGMSGTFLSGGSGAVVGIGSDGGTGYLVAVGVRSLQSDGSKYIGVAHFRCS